MPKVLLGNGPFEMDGRTYQQYDLVDLSDEDVQRALDAGIVLYEEVTIRRGKVVPPKKGDS